MISLKTSKELHLMRQGGRIGAEVLDELIEMVRPGLTTLEIEKKAEELLSKNNTQPAFKNYSPDSSNKKYPAALCVSVNDELVHGIPSKRILADGDIITLDLGVYYKGYYTDMAKTIGVGEISNRDKKLITVTREALITAIENLKDRIRLGDISFLIQKIIEDQGFSVIRDCVGHGIGKEIHEEPSVPNFGKPGTGILLKSGMTLAIEPMASAGSPNVKVKDDGWTITTADRSQSAHFEDTIAIEKNGYQVLTALIKP